MSSVRDMFGSSAGEMHPGVAQVGDDSIAVVAAIVRYQVDGELDHLSEKEICSAVFHLQDAGLLTLFFDEEKEEGGFILHSEGLMQAERYRNESKEPRPSRRERRRKRRGK